MPVQVWDIVIIIFIMYQSSNDIMPTDAVVPHSHAEELKFWFLFKNYSATAPIPSSLFFLRCTWVTLHPLYLLLSIKPTMCNARAVLTVADCIPGKVQVENTVNCRIVWAVQISKQTFGVSYHAQQGGYK